MAHESENTPALSEYAQRMADTLAANRALQSDLTRRLAQLQQEEAWLSQATGPMSGAAAPAAAAPAPAVAEVTGTVPKPRRDRRTAAAIRTSEGVSKKAAAKKTTAKRAKRVCTLTGVIGDHGRDVK